MLFTKNVILKLFSNAEKTENMPEFEFERFRGSSLGDYVHATFIWQQLGLLSLHNFMYVTNFIQ